MVRAASGSPKDTAIHQGIADIPDAFPSTDTLRPLITKHSEIDFPVTIRDGVEVCAEGSAE